MNGPSNLAEINAESWTVIKYQFRNTTSDWIHFSEQPFFDSIQSLDHDGLSFRIQRIEPLSEWLATIIPLTNDDLPSEGFQARLRAFALL